MDHQDSPCHGSLKWMSESFDSKVNSIGQLDAKKLAETGFSPYVFSIGFPASLIGEFRERENSK